MLAVVGPLLTQVSIGTDDVDRATTTLAAALAVEPAAEGASRVLVLGATALVIHPRPTRTGIDRLTVGRSPIAPGRTTLNGLDVELGPAPPTPVDLDRPVDRTDGGATARVDHVAVLVADLEPATTAWERLLGVTGERIGLHPVSGGAFAASRLPLGDQMIELVSPVAGVDSPLARRLAERGEGPATLAVPVTDLAAAETRLAAAGVAVLDQPPHRMLHPRDTGGVLVQLTPRVAH